MMFSKKTIIVAAIVVAATAAGLYWHFGSKTTLVDLQKRYLFAETDEEKDKIIQQLEEYYLNLDVPDSISQRVTQEVQALLDTTTIDLADYSDDFLNESNPYVLENKLHRDLLKKIMIARARGEEQTFRQLMAQARKAAKIVDKGTENDYWVGFVEELGQYNQKKAIKWLYAEKSTRLCELYHDATRYFEMAEKYASFGLGMLQSVEDQRLRYDIIQRLQYILYLFHGLNDLSIVLAEYGFKNTLNIGYFLRANGLLYHQAEALYRSGQIEVALELFQKVNENAEILMRKRVPSMLWYKINAMHLIADSYWQLGEYEKALSICEKVEEFQLTLTEKMVFHTTKALVHQRLGNYGIAESEFIIALSIADSTRFIFNKIQILHNLGGLYFELTEYDKALEYYSDARNLLEQFNIQNGEQKINLLIDLASLMFRNNRFDSVSELVQEADMLIADLGNQPWRKADLLLTLGNFNMQISQLPTALRNFEDAESICQKNGMLRLGLKVKLSMARCLVDMNKNSMAKSKLSEVLNKTKNIEDVERILDATALLAEIEKQEGNIKKAILLSNQLIKRIEVISSQPNNKERLPAFRQKIYDYIKNAVTYEIQNNRIDSAFVKLAYAKARSLKNIDEYNNGNYNGERGHVGYVNLDTLKSYLGEKNVLIDYLITRDTLYAFLLDHNNLTLFKKSIVLDELKNKVAEYKNSIHGTIEVLKDFNQQKIENHFKTTTVLGQQLFNQLMGWPGLRKRLKSVDLFYIIPDEFLYDLPFATLVMDIADNPNYLSKETSVVYLAGPSFLHRMVKTSKIQNLSRKKVLISANLNFPGAKELVSFLNYHFPFAEQLQVTKEPFKKDILDRLNHDYDVYIVIGHGRANEKYPENSYIEFTATNSSTAKPITIEITVGDLKNSNWPGAEMVMLIGCETGRGKLYRGTGISGLQQSFISMGAKAVLASLWKIDAGQAIPQAQDFIQFWLDGSEPAIALRKAQLKSIKNLKNEVYNSPHPYFWGSFSLQSSNPNHY